MEVLIDGVLYVPKSETIVSIEPDILSALESLTEIQYFPECRHKHRAWAWDALKAIAPDIAEMSSNNPETAFNYVRQLLNEE